MHIVDELIEERAKKLMSRPAFWAILKPVIYKALGYKKAVKVADTVWPMKGQQAFQAVSEQLAVDAQIFGASNIPRTGPLIIIANHPTGLSDGVFVFDALKTIRPDHMFMANADALRVIPKAEDIIIPVEWVKEKRTPAKTRATLKALNTALAENKTVVIFPSGVLADLTWRGLVEKPWNPTAVSIARKHNIPIVPLRIKSRNSVLYYLFAGLNDELRDITLFHELLNKKNANPKLIFGPVIQPQTLPKGTRAANEYVRGIVSNLA